MNLKWTKSWGMAGCEALDTSRGDEPDGKVGLTAQIALSANFCGTNFFYAKTVTIGVGKRQ